jgi:hypothetical protein
MYFNKLKETNMVNQLSNIMNQLEISSNFSLLFDEFLANTLT